MAVIACMEAFTARIESARASLGFVVVTSGPRFELPPIFNREPNASASSSALVGGLARRVVVVVGAGAADLDVVRGLVILLVIEVGNEFGNPGNTGSGPSRVFHVTYDII